MAADLLPGPGAELLPAGHQLLARTMASTGADVAVGLGASGLPTALATSRLISSVADCPDLLRVATPGATLWRRAAWPSWSDCWPDDPRRHQAALARLLARATSIAIVAEPVTAAQVCPPVRALRAPRPLAADLVGLPAQLADLTDAALALPGAARVPWWRSVVERALHQALLALPEADPQTQKAIARQVATSLHAMPPEVREGLRPQSSAAYALVEAEQLPMLLDLIRAERSGSLNRIPIMRTPEGAFRDWPAPAAGGAAAVRLAPDAGFRSRIDLVRWEGGRLVVEGHAYLPTVDLPTKDADELTMTLVRTGDQRRVPVQAQRVRRPDVAADAREVGIDYSWAGFRAVVDPPSLRDTSEWRYGVWRLEATVRGVDGVPVSAVVSTLGGGGVRRPERRAIDDVLIVPATDRGTFAIEVDTVPARIVDAAVHDGQLVLRADLRRRSAKGEVQVEVLRPSGRIVTIARGEWKGTRRKALRARLPIADLTAALADAPLHHSRWALRIQLPQSTRTSPLRLALDLPDLPLAEGPATVRLMASAAGRAVLAVGPAAPSAGDAGWVEDQLVVSGSWPQAYEAELVLLSRETPREHPLPRCLPAAERFSLAFRPGAVGTLAGDLPLPHGRWVFAVRAPHGPDTPLRCAEQLLTTLPMKTAIGGRSYTLTSDGEQLELVVGSDLAEDERGPSNQHRLRTVEFPAFVHTGLRDEILFESYESRAYGDNARAVLEEVRRRDLGLQCRWVVVDGQTSLPEGVEAVARNSRAYYEALARSRYLIVPNYRSLDTWYETPPDQVVVQTWHGAPYKRIALDNPRGEAFSAPAYAERLRRESARWNWLLSPNPDATPLLRQAFDYAGPMLETGYPRTDIFFAADREQRAAQVRERLGLPAGKRVVMYAPTMRDDHNYGNNRFRLDLQLDLAAARAALGDDHVMLLRRHAKVVDGIAADGEFARDVSLWPDVNELLLVTDVLVTDYSSLLFDFACTGRPMLFFTYDLADYRDRLRGLYFDPAILPGPQLATSEEVVSAIRDAPALRQQLKGAYESFTSRFCAWDDGRAAARFVDQVFCS